jgi:hypothetical protein
MQFCDECLNLESRLRRANERFASLALRQDRMVRDGADATTRALLDNTLEQALGVRTAVTELLLEHHTLHRVLSLRPKATAAGQVQESAGQCR